MGRVVNRMRAVHPGEVLREEYLAPLSLSVNALAMAGRREQAREHFERLLSHRTRLGLLSEDIDPATGEWWGNFPQTYSLVGIVNSAIRLSRSWEEAL